MGKNLVIVESPAKAKTINKYLGDDYVVASSNGHIRDLPKKSESVDVENGFNPTYEISAEKKDVVANLKKLAKDADEIYLATDEDREGEAISWHLCEILGLDPKVAKRISYTEITKDAILRAVNEPRKINLDLVMAQQARRVLDRLVGFELSPVLWRKVKPSLSAGRVQSVAVRLIVERERDIQGFTAESTFKITAEFHVADESGNLSLLKAEHPKRFQTEEEAEFFLKDCLGADFSIASIEKKPGKKSPAPPFTTSTLQQEASRKLSYSVSQTMVLAQKLYEEGHITYMRTDSVNLSDLALSSSADEIEKRYGEKYSNTRQYSNKNSGAQEAHEAIRPTDFSKDKVNVPADQLRLYELIWKRSIASQMSNAEIEKTVVSIDISTREDNLTASGEVLVFDGFLRVYKEGQDEPQEESGGMLPPLTEGQSLELIEMLATERFSRSKPRYTEASLVKRMEELGIGRPSTYAPTISTIQKRGYVEKDTREGVERAYRVLKLTKDVINKVNETEITGAEKAKLFPTDIGIVVNDFLIEHFDNIMDYSFTAKIEEEFDEIANGDRVWNDMINAFYTPFHRNVSDTQENAERASGERILGDHPESGEVVKVRIGRYGPMAQIGEASEEKKPQYARLRQGQTITTITLEEALDLFKLPRVLGEFEEKEVKVSIGRFGPYVLHDNKFVSLGKENDPYTVGLETAIELIKAKREADAKKLIADFPDHEMQVLNGRWGPYIKKGKDNYKIPKEQKEKAEELTLEDCLEIVENSEPSGRRRRKK